MRKTMRVSCWCYAIEKQVAVEGKIVGHRQADLMKIIDCEIKDCSLRYAANCLIGKLRESRWP